MKKGYSKAALFLASQAITLLGSSIVQFAIIWYVTLETSSGGWVALLSAAAYSSFLPIGMVVFGLLADRTSMRLLMVVSGGLLILTAAVVFWDKSFYRHGLHL